MIRAKKYKVFLVSSERLPASFGCKCIFSASFCNHNHSGGTLGQIYAPFLFNVPECFPRREGASGDDEEDVEDGGPDDGADTHVALGDEHADDGGEELGGRPARSHERRTSDIRTDSQLKVKNIFYLLFSKNCETKYPQHQRLFVVSCFPW